MEIKQIATSICCFRVFARDKPIACGALRFCFLVYHPVNLFLNYKEVFDFIPEPVLYQAYFVQRELSR